MLGAMLGVALLMVVSGVGAPLMRDGHEDLQRLVVAEYGAHVRGAYEDSLKSAAEMRAAIMAFCASPSKEGLDRARELWSRAHEIYGRTEAFRFGNGPIDARVGGVETFVNAWPVDEAFIEPVPGGTGQGILGDSQKYPALGRAILRLHNQRGGETHVCTGWHAIEFMLWGQDRSEDGPGCRPETDFVEGAAPLAARRKEYLREIADLLCEDLERLVRAWRPEEGSHRHRFEADPKAALKSILTGVALLAAFEMSGERMAVAYETRDQEEETNCFSDTTHLCMRANMAGIASVLRGAGGGGVIAVVAARDPSLANALTDRLLEAERAVMAVPAPFDRAVRAPDGSEERARIRSAIEALEALGRQVGVCAKALGYTLPSEPQG